MKKVSAPPVKINLADQLSAPKTTWFCKSAWIVEGGAFGECPTTITFTPDKSMVITRIWKGKKVVEEGEYTVKGTTITGDLEHGGRPVFSMYAKKGRQVVSISTGRYTFERR